MQNFALAFAPKKSFLYQWGQDSRPILHSFKVKEGKEEGNRILLPDEVYVGDKLLFSLFSEGDHLYTEMGGRNGPFCLQVLARGVDVFRIPFFRVVGFLGQEQDENQPDEPDEVEKKEGKAQINRKKRAKLLMELAQDSPELFYPMLQPEETIARIKTYINSFVDIQQDLRIPAQLRHYAMELDFGWLPNPRDAKYLSRIRETLANQTDIEYYLRLEERFMVAIEKELPQVAIWTDFLKDIKGIGPSVGGRLVAAIEDIRRFPKRDDFRAYAAWSVIEGKAPRFRRRQNGEDVGPKFNPELRQALFLLSEQIVRQEEKNPYHSLYRRKKAYYQNRDPQDAPIIHERRARRAAASKFLNDLWAAWWRLYEKQGTELPKTVLQVLHLVAPGKKK